MKTQVIEHEGAYRVVAEGVPHFGEDGRELYQTNELVAEGLAGRNEAERAAKEYSQIVFRRTKAFAELARVRLGEPTRLLLKGSVAVGGYVQHGGGIYRVVGPAGKTEGHRLRQLLEVTPLEWSALQAEIASAGAYPSRQLTELAPVAEGRPEGDETEQF